MPVSGSQSTHRNVAAAAPHVTLLDEALQAFHQRRTDTVTRTATGWGQMLLERMAASRGWWSHLPFERCPGPLPTGHYPFCRSGWSCICAPGWTHSPSHLTSLFSGPQGCKHPQPLHHRPISPVSLGRDLGAWCCSRNWTQTPRGLSQAWAPD